MRAHAHTDVRSTTAWRGPLCFKQVTSLIVFLYSISAWNAYYVEHVWEKTIVVHAKLSWGVRALKPSVRERVVKSPFRQIKVMILFAALAVRIWNSRSRGWGSEPGLSSPRTPCSSNIPDAEEKYYIIILHIENIEHNYCQFVLNLSAVFCFLLQCITR